MSKRYPQYYTEEYDKKIRAKKEKKEKSDVKSFQIIDDKLTQESLMDIKRYFSERKFWSLKDSDISLFIHKKLRILILKPFGFVFLGTKGKINKNNINVNTKLVLNKMALNDLRFLQDFTGLINLEIINSKINDVESLLLLTTLEYLEVKDSNIPEEVIRKYSEMFTSTKVFSDFGWFNCE